MTKIRGVIELEVTRDKVTLFVEIFDSIHMRTPNNDFCYYSRVMTNMDGNLTLKE